MADLYRTNACPSNPSPSSLPLESEDMSTFFHHHQHQLLHNQPSASSSTCMSTKSTNMHPLLTSAPESRFSSGLFHVKVSEDQRRSDLFDARIESDSRVRDGNLGVVGASSCFNFSDPGGYFSTDHAIASSSMALNYPAENNSDGYGYDSEKGPETSEVPTNLVLPRGSSKRSRAAEIHNLSEKRRRSRINEKMKALQKLIPNSNKTDKASMLDEAIEYLKQLQLQVQMLSMRNGSSMHPMYLPGGLQSMQLMQTGTAFDESHGLLNTNAGSSSVPAPQEHSLRTAFDISTQGTSSNHSMLLPNLSNLVNAEAPFGYEPVMETQYIHFNLPTPSKDLGGEDKLPELELDTSHSGNMKINSSSSGVL